MTIATDLFVRSVRFCLAALRCLLAAICVVAVLVPLQVTHAAPAREANAPAPAAQTPCSPLVTSTADSGSGSLRAIVACAASGATIRFSPSVFSTTQTITLASDRFPE